MSSQITLVLVDLVMPSSPGIEVIRRIREEWPHLRTIATTLHASSNDLEIASYMGARAALTKPISLEWFETIGTVLGSKVA
jgi:DNA-binding NarL/FixJ family response regulator